MSEQRGIVTAVVATKPDSQGRLGLRYPILPRGMSLDPEYAPVAAALAGPSRGAWLMPEEGDEVLVAFDRSDRPFVVGFLWNGKQGPPETDKDNRVFLTPGGNTLRFEDGGSKKIVLATAAGHGVTIEDSGTITVSIANNGGSAKLDASSVTLKAGGHQIVLDSSGVAIT